MAVFLIIAMVFCFLQLTLAFLLIIMGIHGPDSLPVFTLSWLAIIQIILWFGFSIFRKSKNKYAAVYFIFLCMIVTATAPLMFFLAEQYDEFKYNDILTNTEIHNVRDKLLLTKDGKPFGIIFSFSIKFPDTGYIYITPLLRPGFDPYGRKPDPNDMRILHYSAEPALKNNYYFKKGVVYDMEFAMVPGYLINQHPDDAEQLNENPGNYCLQYPVQNVHLLTRDMFENIITTDNPDHYQVAIHGTVYGNTGLNNETAYTRNKYNPLDFYNTYKSMQINECNYR